MSAKKISEDKINDELFEFINGRLDNRGYNQELVNNFFILKIAQLEDRIRQLEATKGPHYTA